MRRLLVLLPPVLAVAVVVFLFLRSTGDAARDAVEERIRTRWESAAERRTVADEVRGYHATHADPRAAWFAAETFAHLRDVPAAVDAIRSVPAARDEAGAARRFALLLCEILSRTPGKPEIRGPLWSRLLLTRLDGSAPGADEEWAEIVPQLRVEYLMTWYQPLRRTRSRANDVVAEGFASRTDLRELRAAGALLRTGPARRGDVPFLLEIFGSSWREERRPMWQNTVRALGASLDPAAVAALRAMREKTANGGDTRSANALDVGLALAGDTDARERVLASEDDSALAWRPIQYVVGLGTRLAQGDEGALPRLLEAWERATTLPLRMQIAQVTLLADPKPPAHAAWVRFADQLAASDDPVARAAAHAARLRERAEPPFGPLADLLRETLATENLAGDVRPEELPANVLVEVLRAWLRFGGA